MKPLDLRGARRAARGGAFAAIVLSVATTVFAFLAPNPQASITRLFAVWAPADVVLYAAIAFGIYKTSRLAAVAGLTLYSVERIFVWAVYDRIAPMMLIFLAAFIIAARGIFAYQRLVKREIENTPKPN